MRISFLLVIGLCFSCGNIFFAQSLNVGNIYVNKEVQMNDRPSFAVLALRIEKKMQKSLLIKYKIGEVFLDGYIYKTDKKNSYKGKLFIDLYTKKRVNVEFYTDKDITLVSEGKKYDFVFSYKDTVVEQEVGNPYFAEDGFGLFKKNAH